MKRTGPTLSDIPRHELVAAALELGIERPEQLSPEQLREQIRAASSAAHDPATPGTAAEGTAAHGTGVARRVSLFSVARNLIASVVERGLNLPDAARVIRDTVRPSPRHRPPLPTVTLAQIYLAQGYTDRALQTLTAVIEREPNNYKAVELYQRLTPPREASQDSAHGDASPTWVGRASVAAGPAPAAEPWYHAGAPPTRGLRDALVLVERLGKEITVYWELADRRGDATAAAAEVRVSCFGGPSGPAGAAPRQIPIPVRAAFGWAVVELLDHEIPEACLAVGGRVVASALHVRSVESAGGAAAAVLTRPRRGFWQDVIERAVHQ